MADYNDPLTILLMAEGEYEEAEALQSFYEAGTHVSRPEQND